MYTNQQNSWINCIYANVLYLHPKSKYRTCSNLIRIKLVLAYSLVIQWTKQKPQNTHRERPHQTFSPQQAELDFTHCSNVYNSFTIHYHRMAAGGQIHLDNPLTTKKKIEKEEIKQFYKLLCTFIDGKSRWASQQSHCMTQETTEGGVTTKMQLITSIIFL